MTACIHDDERIERYRQAVFRMLECVSPEASNSDFHDAINEVLMSRKHITKKEMNKIKWNKYDNLQTRR